MSFTQYLTIPNMISGVRLLLVPLMWGYALSANSVIIGVGLLVAAITDFLDGFLARRFKISTSFGAKLDSLADDLLRVSVVFWVWILFPEVIHDHPLLAWVGLGSYSLSLLVSWVKFRRFGSSLHLYSHKAFAPIGYLFLLHLFFTGEYSLGFYLWVIIIFTVGNIEAVLIQLLLSKVNENLGSLLLVVGNSIATRNLSTGLVPSSLVACFIRTVLRAFASIYSRQITITGTEHLSPGPKIYVANHPRYTDAYLLPFVIPGKFSILITEGFFFTPIIHWLLSKVDQIPVLSNGGMQTLEHAKAQLEKGHSIVIFPEGRLIPGERVGRGRTGAVRLSLMTGAPLIPLGIHVDPGNTIMLPGWVKGRIQGILWQFRGTSFFHFSAPWRPSTDHVSGPEYAKPRLLTDQLMGRIQLAVEHIQQGKIQ